MIEGSRCFPHPFRQPLALLVGVPPELKREQFLSRWDYRATEKGFVLAYWPGEKFFEDQNNRLRRKRSSLSSPSAQPLTPDQQQAIFDILDLIPDFEDPQAVVTKYHIGHISLALGDTKTAMRDGVPNDAASYFMGTLKAIAQKLNQPPL